MYQTVKEECEKFIDRCFVQPVPDHVRAALTDAFYSGVISTLATLREDPDSYDRLVNELKDWGEDRFPEKREVS